MATGRARHLLGDRYRLLSPVRRDGGGILWHGHDLLLKRDVALKEVSPPYEVDMPDLPAARRQALHEARAAARLSHPAIITVHDLLEDRGRLWIVTELLSGLTLDETVEHVGRLPVRWAAWVGFQLLAGVRHAHATGVVHGDIRPGTVLLTGDRVVLTDFGIAAMGRDAGGSAPPPARSAAYVAPERMRGAPAAPEADLWSFGATLYWVVEGRAPFPGTGPLAERGTGGLREPDPPDEAGPLRPVLEGLLRRDPAERLTAEEATRLLVGVLRREGIAAAPPGRRAEELPPDAFTM